MTGIYPIVALGLLVTTPMADPTVKIGDRVEKLTFKDSRFLPRSLDDFKDARAYVLVFTNTTCPIVQKYWPILKEMEKQLRDKGVQFVAVNVGNDDTILTMAAQSVKYGVEFPIVKDMDGSGVKALGVQRTPEVVVLDAEKRIRYRGRIDDRHRLGGGRSEATCHELKDALTLLLAGQEIVGN